MAGSRGSGSWQALARLFGASFVLQSAGLGLMFLSQLILARVLGASGFGVYSYTNAWLVTLVLLGRFGCDITVMRFGGTYLADGDWPRFWSLMRVTGAVVLLSSLVASAVMLVVCFGETRARPLNGAGPSMLVAATIIPVLALSGLRQAALVASGHVAKALMPEYLVRPIAIGAGALGLLACWDTASASAGMAANLAATIVAFALGQYWLRNVTPHRHVSHAASEDRAAWITASVSALAFSGAQQLLAQVDMILAGSFTHSEALGHYAAARQLASVGVLGLISFQYSSSPRIAAAYTRRDLGELAGLLRAIAWGGAAFAVLYGVALVLAGAWVLRLFGKGFADAQAILLLLLAGQVISAVGGPAGTVAAMVGLQKSAAVISIVAAALCATLVGILSLRFGILGVAAAVCVSTAAWTIAMNAVICHQTGFTVWIGSRFLWRHSIGSAM